VYRVQGLVGVTVLVGVCDGVLVCVGVGVGVGVAHGQTPVETTETLPPLRLVTTGVVVEQIEKKPLSISIPRGFEVELLQHGV